MSVLEKILEEIDKIKDVIKAPIYDNCFGDECGDNGDCMVCVCEKIMDIIRSHMDDVENDGWIPVSEGLPEVNLKYDNDFCTKYESENVLAQTKKGQYFSAYCDKIERKQSDWKDKIEWFTHGTGGRKMKVVSKVIAWRPLPEPYKGE